MDKVNLGSQIKICTPEEEKAFELFSLPLISTYRVLSWSGSSSGALSANFAAADVIGKIMIIKAFRLIPYADEAMIDLYLDDGAGTVNFETIPDTARIDRLFDIHNSGTLITLLINGTVAPFLITAGPNAANAFPMDLTLDNIFYKHPEKITSLTLSVVGNVFTNIIAGSTATGTCLLKAIMEVYLI